VATSSGAVATTLVIRVRLCAAALVVKRSPVHATGSPCGFLGIGRHVAIDAVLLRGRLSACTTQRAGSADKAPVAKLDASLPGTLMMYLAIAHRWLLSVRVALPVYQAMQAETRAEKAVTGTAFLEVCHRIRRPVCRLHGIRGDAVETEDGAGGAGRESDSRFGVVAGARVIWHCAHTSLPSSKAIPVFVQYVQGWLSIFLSVLPLTFVARALNAATHL
jgi:hypothetical protein